MRIRTYSLSLIFFIFLFHIILVAAADAAIKIMPLGDSITWDDRIVDTRPDGVKVAYRYRLWQLLTNADYEIDFVGSQYTGFNIFPDAENEGHPGWTDDEILIGRPILEPLAGNLAVWLAFEQPQIVLLHIGTNGVDPSPADVAAILDEIDAFGPNVWVVLARIINRSCSTDPDPLITCPESQTTMDFNDNVEDMALDRINNPAPPALPDKIVIVDMEAGAGIDYRLQPVGDMWDNFHPFETGYAKMADLWFTGLMSILPQANAGNTQTVKETATVTLDATGSTDADGTIASYLWEQLTGSVVTLYGASTATAAFTAPVVGPTGETLTFKLTVSDNDGLESTDTVSIEVINTVNPVANAGLDQDAKEGDTVTLDATGSTDADGTIASYSWTQTAGTTVQLAGDDPATPTFTAPGVNQTLTFQLTVTDNDGLASTDTVNIAVTILPQADAGPDQSVDEFDQVTLDASGSAAAGTISYNWTQPVGSRVQLSDATSPTPTFTAPDVGPSGEILTFELKITDDNWESTDTVSITVHNPTSSDGGGGGGGGGCFIATAADGSLMAPSGNTSLVVAPGIPMAGLEFVVAMMVFTSICAAIVLQRRRKR